MAIESKLPTRANPSPAQSSSDATARQARSDHVENRETSTDHANKEIAKPEFDVVQEQARSPQ
ncbi:hypothetical protein G5B88_02805 [Herbaspirillum seropedicae]|uniref:hypothetical protein n=1 Tax=Herbaspirillum seropedicae TaxID=964 RepID=UPI00031A2E37|nr:hypothetical protein [Herbaspirillum seropedicae]AKN64251.1 hypothetical protein ACP92_02790 [Herbaspirillum seropedicae]AON52863.1 hypothetical protein Hsc_0557 [Herbaspirillum seropedicae]MDR6397103.1 hypothetical protein [Herbaspirillum seropedicae]NQE27880.1 hypothetical protein [Herbaspirillum seropedicae]UMU20168.1 hypothetical protein G5B88_02805 [Herbaspirillum seropedicae]